jgi:hypothetical protein
MQGIKNKQYEKHFELSACRRSNGTENKLQGADHSAFRISTKLNMAISIAVTKPMAMEGKHVLPSKILINVKIMEQVQTFKHSGNTIPYMKEFGHG